MDSAKRDLAGDQKMYSKMHKRRNWGVELDHATCALNPRRILSPLRISPGSVCLAPTLKLNTEKIHKELMMNKHEQSP